MHEGRTDLFGPSTPFRRRFRVNAHECEDEQGHRNCAQAYNAGEGGSDEEEVPDMEQSPAGDDDGGYESLCASCGPDDEFDDDEPPSTDGDDGSSQGGKPKLRVVK